MIGTKGVYRGLSKLKEFLKILNYKEQDEKAGRDIGDYVDRGFLMKMTNTHTHTHTLPGAL